MNKIFLSSFAAFCLSFHFLGVASAMFVLGAVTGSFLGFFLFSFIDHQKLEAESTHQTSSLNQKRKSRKKPKDFNFSEEEHNQIKDFLLEAMESHEAVTFNYWGGANPGALKTVIPIKLIDGKTVRVICKETYQRKELKLSRIKLIHTSNEIAEDSALVADNVIQLKPRSRESESEAA